VDNNTEYTAAQQKCKGNYYCIVTTTLNGFILVTARCRSTTMQSESIVAFP